MIRAQVMDEFCDAAPTLYKIIRRSKQPGPAETDLEAPTVTFDEISS